MNDNKVKIFEYLDTLVKMCRSKGNGASLIIEEEEIAEQIKEHDLEIDELKNSITNDCYDASAEMADRNIEIITKKLIQQLKSKIKGKTKELEDLKTRENDYSYHIQSIRNNKSGHESYVKSLKARLENSEDEEVSNKYTSSIKVTEEKIDKANHELENQNLEYKLLQTKIEEVATELAKLQDSLDSKEKLLLETQENLKDKNSYLDQSKVDKLNEKIEEVELKKKKLNDRVEEIHNNSQYLVSKIKDCINAEKDSAAYAKGVIDLVNQAHQVPYMNVEANKLLEEALLKATQARDSFALEIDQKNYSLLETLNPGKIRIDYLKTRIEKWNVEKEELREKIFVIDNDQKFNYDEKYLKLNEILDTMKKELAEFEKAFENNDSINLTSKSDLKLSIEEKKREIFDTENILSQFRKDEAADIAYANELYTHNIKGLEAKIEVATKEIESIKSNMIARKNGLIDITSQNRDKDKLKELAVKVIDIKHRRQFAEKPIEIAKELEQLLGIEIVPSLAVIEEEPIEKTIQDIKLIIGDSSIELNVTQDEKEAPKEQPKREKEMEGPKITIEPEIEEPKVEEKKEQPKVEEPKKEVKEEPKVEEELQPKDFNLEIPPTRGVKVVEQAEIEEEDVVTNPVQPEQPKVELIPTEPIPTVEAVIDEEPVATENQIPTPVAEEASVPTIEEEITLSNENVEPEQVLAEQQLENPMIQPIALDDEKELAIGEMFKENSSQNNANNDNIVLDNELSQELDQYLNNLDLPNS